MLQMRVPFHNKSKRTLHFTLLIIIYGIFVISARLVKAVHARAHRADARPRAVPLIVHVVGRALRVLDAEEVVVGVLQVPGAVFGRRALRVAVLILRSHAKREALDAYVTKKYAKERGRNEQRASSQIVPLYELVKLKP